LHEIDGTPFAVRSTVGVSALVERVSRMRLRKDLDDPVAAREHGEARRERVADNVDAPEISRVGLLAGRTRKHERHLECFRASWAEGTRSPSAATMSSIVIVFDVRGS